MYGVVLLTLAAGAVAFRAPMPAAADLVSA
jgi:hypothetical protein